MSRPAYGDGTGKHSVTSSNAEENEPRLIDIVLLLEDSEDKQAQKLAVAKKLGLELEAIHELRLRKHSIDARQKTIKVQLRFEVGVNRPLSAEDTPQPTIAKVADAVRRVLIIGCGPAGMFAALQCIKKGMKPIVLERGKDASARRFDLGPILKRGEVIEDSNYCFGEGGAGTFSDGKLYTRATKRGPVREIYETLVAHGAPERILIDAHPHIGSNLLPKVVMAIRKTILEAGGEVHFGAKVCEFIIKEGSVRGLHTKDGREFEADQIILATGHSARDIYYVLNKKNVPLEQKQSCRRPCRAPTVLIDELQYHLHSSERPRLLFSSYRRLS